MAAITDRKSIETVSSIIQNDADIRTQIMMSPIAYLPSKQSHALIRAPWSHVHLAKWRVFHGGWWWRRPYAGI